MMKTIQNTLLALGIGLSGMAVAPVAAQDIQLEIGRDGLRLRDGDRCDPRYEECYRPREVMRRGCTEGRALDKAARMGVRRAVVTDAGRRTIEVAGRTRGGERVYLVFGRAPNCPVYN